MSTWRWFCHRASAASTVRGGPSSKIVMLSAIHYYIIFYYDIYRGGAHNGVYLRGCSRKPVCFCFFFSIIFYARLCLRRYLQIYTLYIIYTRALLFRRPFSKTRTPSPSTLYTLHVYTCIYESLPRIDGRFLFVRRFFLLLFFISFCAPYGSIIYGVRRVAHKTRFRVVKVLKGKRYRRLGRRPVSDVQRLASTAPCFATRIIMLYIIRICSVFFNGDLCICFISV